MLAKSIPCPVCGNTFRPQNWRVKCCSISCGQHLRFGPIEERFWSKVDKSAGPDACWPWKAGKDKDGYGLFALEPDLQIRAHRYAFEQANGSIDPDLMVLHACDNPPCCNPKCLSQGTVVENARQAVARGRIATGERHGSRTHPERIPRGERNGAYTHPEQKLRGDSHPARLHPERLARGDQNGSRLHPASYPRGEQKLNAKLTDVVVRDARIKYAAGGISLRLLAAEIGVSKRTLLDIIQRKTWKHVT